MVETNSREIAFFSGRLQAFPLNFLSKQNLQRFHLFVSKKVSSPPPNMPKSSKRTPSKDHRHSAAADPTSPVSMAPPSSLDSFLGSVCSGIKQRVDEEVARRISESTAVSTSQHEQLEDEVSCLRMEVTRIQATLNSRNVEMASLAPGKGRGGVEAQEVGRDGGAVDQANHERAGRSDQGHS